jgi:hypothetical protein
MAMEYTEPNNRQRQLIRKRGLNWHDFLVIKELNYALFLYDKRFNSTKIIDKKC